MMFKRVRLLMLQLLAVGIVFGFCYEYVHASEHDETSFDDVSEEYVIESSGEVLSEDSIDVGFDEVSYDSDELDSSDVTDEELESEASSSPALTSSGSTVIVQQDNDDSAVRALLNAFMERKDTLNGFEKQVLNRLDVLSVGCIIIVAIVVIRLFFK